MNSRTRIRAIVNRRQSDRCGLWLGNPHPDSWPGLHSYFGTGTEEQLRQQLQDDFRWIAPWSAWQHPDGKPLFDLQRPGITLSEGGVFAEATSVREIESFDWPDPDYLDFSDVIGQLDSAGDVYRAGGFWSPFFHELCDFFGMENYFLKMYTDPEVVLAATRHLVDFYLEANRRLFEAVGDRLDAFFFGNDFGSQSGLLIAPEQFRQFVFPFFEQLTQLAHQYDLQVILHSCGSIREVIPDLITMGVEALHPLQALANGMEPAELAQFRERLAFVGGIDTQQLLVHGSADEVRAEVRRVKELLGPALVVSPSHEAVLPNVPPANLAVMAETALEVT